MATVDGSETTHQAADGSYSPADEAPMQPPDNAVAAWIFLNPGGAWALPHLYEGDPVEILFTLDHTVPGGPSWRDRLVTAVRRCCPGQEVSVADYGGQRFEAFTVPPLVAAWLEWLTDDGSYSIATLAQRGGEWRVLR